MLESYWANFINLVHADEAELGADERDSFEEGYFAAKSQLLSLLNKIEFLKPIERIVIADQTRQPIKLPSLKLRTFSGILIELLDFWSAFDSKVDK